MSSPVLYEAAKETVVEYFQKTSLNGFGLLYYIRRRKYQRLFWFLFIVMCVTFSIYVCLTTIMSFLSEPTVTALDTQPNTIWSVPFPSIAVCSNNKLSHYAIRQYARNLTRSSFDYNPPKYWKKKLELFAGLLNTESIDFDEALEFQKEIETIYGKDFQVRETLKALAPSCENIIVECYWAGQALNCKEQFKLMAFIEGTCCVFNYQYGSSLDNLYYPKAIGPEMGLALVLNASTNDYFYAEGSSNGFNIQIFGTQRIPDVATGEMKEFHVSAGQYVDVKLHLESQITSEDARAHSFRKRGCYFSNEQEEAGFGQSECLMKCKLHIIESLCGCIPFYAFEGGLEEKPNEVLHQCTLANTGCLERYRVTWQTYYPNSANIPAHLKDQLVDSLSCPDCLPLCSYNRYHYSKTTSSIRESLFRIINRKYRRSLSEFSPDWSLVKIYYPSVQGTRYQKNVLFNWYQMLSNIGGVIGICTGCSIISVFEILYFGSFRLMENYLIFKRNRNCTNMKSVK